MQVLTTTESKHESCALNPKPSVQAARVASAVWVLDAIEAKHARQLAEAFAAHPPMRRLSLAKTVIDWPRMEALFHARLPDAEWNAVPSSGWVGEPPCGAACSDAGSTGLRDDARSTVT